MLQCVCVYLKCPDINKQNNKKGKKKCQNLKIKLVDVKIVLVCTITKIVKKIKNHIVKNKKTPPVWAVFYSVVQFNFIISAICCCFAIVRADGTAHGSHSRLV